MRVRRLEASCNLLVNNLTAAIATASLSSTRHGDPVLEQNFLFAVIRTRELVDDVLFDCHLLEFVTRPSRHVLGMHRTGHLLCNLHELVIPLLAQRRWLEFWHLLDQLGLTQEVA